MRSTAVPAAGGIGARKDLPSPFPSGLTLQTGPSCQVLQLLRHKLLQKPPALPQRPLAVGEGGFIRPVLDLHANRPVVAGVAEGGEELTPVHIAQAGDLRCVPAEAEAADVVEPVAVDARVL